MTIIATYHFLNDSLADESLLFVLGKGKQDDILTLIYVQRNISSYVSKIHHALLFNNASSIKRDSYVSLLPLRALFLPLPESRDHWICTLKLESFSCSAPAYPYGLNATQSFRCRATFGS